MLLPGDLEPYAVRLAISARAGAIQSPGGLVGSLLEDIANRCAALGASLVGHVKRHVSTNSGEIFRGSLTDTRHGATVIGGYDGPAAALGVDLVVLPLGLDRDAVEGTVFASLDSRARDGITWFVVPSHGPCPARSHPHSNEEDPL